jgi:hypothetical protein
VTGETKEEKRVEEIIEERQRGGERKKRETEVKRQR